MFHTEQTEIKPAFGITFNQVIATIENNQEQLAQNFFNEGYNELPLLFRNGVGRHWFKMLCNNPHASKILREISTHQPYPLELGSSFCESSSIENADFVYENRNSLSKMLICKNTSPIFETLFGTIAQPISGVDRCVLSENPLAVPYLSKNPQHIDWRHLSTNPEALDLLEENLDKIHYPSLSLNKNPRSIEILRQQPHKITWVYLCQNTCDEAIDLLLENPSRINLDSLALNTNPRAIQILESELQRIVNFRPSTWSSLSKNPLAIELLRLNPHQIHWPNLCLYASTKEQFDLIRENLEQVSWNHLSMNTSPLAMELLEEYPEYIRWEHSIGKQNIFETKTIYNYLGIRNARRNLHEEFHAWAGHPSKMATKWREWGFDDLALEDEEEEDASVGSW